ncbi:pre-rRNA-processing protein esf1 [Didymosphaeria variabile]|uniref:Pre-rRNA-processing protein esf1 n=1 Tax=Didymosphaeria variabile TaxID=1932322 RepID=A0A9W8XKG8_9PLEO|nr:pre-rRNA-processing protein esf1 [Didymosphaeria variabile]KAJ4351575.1 pre-rRNA-processing protein esf1 [Didymosphaeria variabile]
MPLPKRQTVPKATKGSSDSRFAAFETDPKFRLPSKKHAKTKLDPRFSRLRTDSDFYNKASVDKYGRPISKDAGKKDLERMFELDSEGSESEADVPKEKKRDKDVLRELARIQKQGFDPIRDGGLESSSDESDSEDEEEEAEVEDQTELAGQGNEVPMGDVTARIAAVNMDWDNIRATDIMAVANSFVPADGRILNVTIYPSEFGLERMQREEIEGPPKEIFSAAATNRAKNIETVDELKGSDSEDDEQKRDDALNEAPAEDFDSKALRTYQLDRLRYYYALISCSTPNVAKAIYDNLDGREYLSSANFFDLRFVPDEVEFDAEPHEECEKLPNGYKPNDFVTDALSHSKVKLTWDADDTTRKEVQKRAFSRKEIDENELQAYLGTDSSSSEDEEEADKAGKAASLRAALGLDAASKSSQPKSKSSSKKDRDMKKPDTEMEVTFTSGFAANGAKGSVFENEPEENTLEKYVRKQKERKAKRKDRAQAIKEGRDPDAEPATEDAAPAEAEGENPWNDPFFGSDPEAEKALEIKSNKEKRAKKREEREKQEKASAEERANLELLMVDEKDSKMQHFDMNEIIKAEKVKKSKGKKNKKAAKEVPADNFELNTNDPRFAKLFESHDFAIDPTNPRFKETSGMKKLLEEGRKKRKRDREEEPEHKKPKKEAAGEPDDVKKLAARLKAKSKR